MISLPELKLSEFKNVKKCSDYDSECETMSNSEAKYCFNGLIGHPCTPLDFKGLGKADGYCPIITREEN